MPFSTPAPLDGADADAAFVATDAAVPPPTVDVLGVPLALTDYERTMDWMDATIAQGGKGYICVAATHTVVATQDDPELRAAVRAASLVVPNGQPVVWAMNALGHDLTHRVYGPDLMAKSCERAARTGTRMFLYGGRNQGALVQLAARDGRRTCPDLGLGACGEHAGDPASIAFFARTGVDYLSCSPPRIPVVRLEAGRQAVLLAGTSHGTADTR